MPTPLQFQSIADPGACGKTPLVAQNDRPARKPRETGQELTAHSVLIAGGGPTGKMLAAELTLAGADVAVVERRARQEVESSRAGGIQARTVEVLDQRG